MESYIEEKKKYEKVVTIKKNDIHSCIFVGNKCDLGDESRRVSKNEVEEYANSKGVPFLEASALKTINVRESFIRVVHDLLEKTQKSKKSPYNFLYFVLTMDRKRLYDRINQRVDIMIENGLIEEVKMLLDMGYDKDLTSMQGIGYKEIIDYLNGNCTKDECIYNIKINTRHFAKRQLTWYRREKDVIWINKDEFENEEMMLKYILEIYDKNIGNKK